MILATTKMDKIKKSELEKMYNLYGDTGKKLEQKIIQSLSARYFCHIICQNNIKCSKDGFVKFEDLDLLSQDDFFIEKNISGETYIKNKDLYLSLSHSDAGVLAGVSSSKIGADIQKIKSYNEKIAKRYFSNQEIEYILNSEDINKTFSLVWSFKESLFKSGYVPKKDFWKNSKDERYSFIENNDIKQTIKLPINNENNNRNLFVFARFCENFVITGICDKKEVILLVI